jgi:hypothetical protein
MYLLFSILVIIMTTVSVILFCINDHINYIDDVIKSFSENEITKFYVLHYDKIDKNISSINSNNVVHINLQKYNYNINTCYNQLKDESDVWITWKSTYIFNNNKNKSFTSLITDIKNKKYSITFIFGIKLFLDKDCVKKDTEYSCKNGGCFLFRNTVTLNENELYFSVNKEEHNIFYNLYDNNEYYFFDTSLIKSARSMLLHDFESLYMSVMKKNNVQMCQQSFLSWYESNYKPIICGEIYVKKKYEFEGRKTRTTHSFNLPYILTQISEPIKYFNFEITYIIILTDSSQEQKAISTINSICSNKYDSYNIVLVLNYIENVISDIEYKINKNILILKQFQQKKIITCYNNIFSSINTDLVCLIKAGTILIENATINILNKYNYSELDNIFVYFSSINGCILNNCDNLNYNIVSFKLKHYYQLNGFSEHINFGNENYDILFKLETICNPIILLDQVIEYSEQEYSDIMINYEKISLVIDNVKSRYGNLNFTTNLQIMYSNGIKICHIDLYKSLFHKQFMNIYFDKIYSDKNINMFDKNDIIYEIINLDDQTLINRCYVQKLKRILICHNNENYQLHDDFLNIFKKNMTTIPTYWGNLILGTCYTGYNLKCEQKFKNISYYFDPPICTVIKSNLVKINPYPKVSIIMTVYNKEKYVDDSIQSVLKQSYKNLELILVEDCSTDSSRQIINKYKKFTNVIIIENKVNSGCYVSRNIGILNATGDIIGFQDADDYTISTRVEKQIKFMNKYNLLMVGCNMIRSHIPNINYNDDKQIFSAVETYLEHFDCDCCTNMFGYPTLLIKKELFNKFGLYIERKKGMDMEFPERIMFKLSGKIFTGSSWEFFDKESNEIYKKLDELLVISPDMDNNNITNAILSDDYLKFKQWRQEYI